VRRWGGAAAGRLAVTRRRLVAAAAGSNQSAGAVWVDAEEEEEIGDWRGRRDGMDGREGGFGLFANPSNLASDSDWGRGGACGGGQSQQGRIEAAAAAGFDAGCHRRFADLVVVFSLVWGD
jgi:hypothetical protein